MENGETSDNEIRSQVSVKSPARYRERLDGVEGIRLSAVQEDAEPNCAYFPIYFSNDRRGNASKITNV